MVLQIIFGGVGAIALLVAAIGIANTMAMAILERTREIGLMKAIGATNRDVLSIFLGEAAGIGFIGGMGGVLLGWSAGQIINVLAMAYLAGQAATSGGTAASGRRLYARLAADIYPGICHPGGPDQRAVSGAESRNPGASECIEIRIGEEKKIPARGDLRQISNFSIYPKMDRRTDFVVCAAKPHTPQNRNPSYFRTGS